MVDQEAFIDAVATYSRLMMESYDVGSALYALTDQVVDVLHADGAGVSVAHSREAPLQFVAASDSQVASLEVVQEVEDGPCTHAFREGRRIVCGDLGQETRWPAYVTAALDHGFGAVAGLPMPLGDRRIGALNLYMRLPYDWDDVELRVGQALADMAAGYILSRNEMTESRSVIDQLQRALDSRVVIEQAKGIVAARAGISTEEAFRVLRRRARATGTRLHDVCRTVVETTEPS